MKAGVSAALQMQLAVATEVLLMAPLRLGNLAGIDLSRHLVFTHGGRRCTLVLQDNETKNKVDLEFPLPETSTALIRRYLDNYRPRLVRDARCTALFPGEAAEAKHAGTLRVQLTEAIKTCADLQVNPHLFRHIGAKIFLDRNPGAYEVIRRVLGHKSMKTTTGFYTGLEAAAAARHFDETVLRLRQPECTA
jgi:integrase